MLASIGLDLVDATELKIEGDGHNGQKEMKRHREG